MVELIRTWEEVMALVPAWRALDERAGHPLLHLAPDWVLPWYDAFADAGAVRLAVLRDGDALRAVAPFMIHAQRLGPFPTRMLRLIYNGHSTRSDVLCAPNDSAAAGHLLDGLLRGAADWDVIELRDLAANSPTVPVIRECVAGRHVGAEWLASGMRTPVLLCLGSWAEYYDGRSRNFRRNVSRAWAKLERRGAGKIVSCTTPDAVRAGLRTLAHIEAAGWKGTAGTALAADTRAFRFYANMVARFAARGAADLSILRIDGRPAAACLAVRHGRTVYGLKLGFDPAFADGSPGLLLALAMLERHWSRDTNAFDLMQTSTFPADRLTDRFEERLRLRVFTGGMYSRMVGAVKLGYGRLRAAVAAGAPS